MTEEERRDRRRRVLASHGAAAAEIEALLAYNENPFDQNKLDGVPAFPLPAAPHIQAWKAYEAEATIVGPLKALSSKLPQLCFPIQEGISQSDSYRGATLRGRTTEGLPEAVGLILTRPEKLRLEVHESLAGPVPLLLPEGREDFEILVRALSMRNEPKPVPTSMGACTVRGYNNWDRVRSYRQAWELESPDHLDEGAWAAEFQRLIPRKEQYQDEFLILSDGPYSGIPAETIGLDEASWSRVSLAIRSDHECTHYITQRLFGVTRNNALDELLCDYVGIVAGAGNFRSDWLLLFLGLEGYPEYRDGGRLQNYLGTPALSDDAFRVLRSLVYAAARNLERYEQEDVTTPRPIAERGPLLLSLTRLTLEEMASEEGVDHIRQGVAVFERL